MRIVVTIYLMIGFWIAVFTAFDCYLQNSRDEVRWWKILRVFAFCLFIAPGYALWLSVKKILRPFHERP